MPIIEVTMGCTDDEHKDQLVRELTEAAVKVTGLDAMKFTVVIHEMGDTNIGWGGRTMRDNLQGRPGSPS